jgi:cell division protein FtsI (penicillin-binding protein 3)
MTSDSPASQAAQGLGTLSTDARRSQQRLVMLGAVVVAAGLIIVGRLAYWQVLAEDEILAGDDSPRQALPARRGAIFDSRGYAMAVELYTYTVSAAPNQISDPAEAAQTLGAWLGMAPEEIQAAISDPEEKYAPIARNVDATTGEAIAALDIDGVELTVEPQRSYPYGTLAGHVLGFVNQEGDASYGLEEYYDRELTGRPGSWSVQASAAMLADEPNHQLVPPHDGYDLVLTIDRVVQQMVEEKLAASIDRYSATGGTVIVLQPSTGAILALANYPPFDPNAYATTPAERWTNIAVSAQYEPGSVVKVLTLAAGLDASVVTPDSTYHDVGTIEYGGALISNWDHIAHGTTTITRMLQLSLNLGAVHIADLLGRDRFYDYMQRFGLGQPTGVDLASEAPGLLRTPQNHRWYPADLATNSFGQGMATTPLQLITAVAAIGNDGWLMRPYVVDRIMDGDTVVRRTRPTRIRQVVSETAAHQTAELMVEVVEGEVVLAAIPGYRVAGKTGTAQIPVPGGYDPLDSIASFVGFVPAENPQFAVLVKLDRTQQHRGAWTAAPLFGEISSELVRLLGVPPDIAHVHVGAGLIPARGASLVAPRLRDTPISGDARRARASR